MTENVDIKEVFWKALKPGETPSQAWTTAIHWGELYDHGFVDPRRLPKNRWMDILKQLPAEKGQYVLSPDHVGKIAQFLYAGPIKRPFDPQRLKEGVRPPQWIQEMYQKVLKFETDIKPAEWNQMVHALLNPTFMENGQYRFDQDLKDVLSEILMERASPLRKLELWVFEGAPEEVASAPAKTSAPPPTPSAAAKPIKDRFESGPEEIKKIRSIEKLYYHAEKSPASNDRETLDFLNELDDLKDEGEEIK
jgi:hypothetical protein